MKVKLVHFLLKYYAKTFRYVAPLLFFIVFFIINYSQKALSIWQNYSFTSVAMFLFSAWITIGFISFEDFNQQQITILHVRNQSFYYIARIISSWVITILLDICVVLYPVIFNLFNRTIKVEEIIIAIVIHALFSLLAVSVTILFDPRIVYNRRTALIGLFAVLILAVCQSSIIKDYVFFKYIVWVLPPIGYITEILNNINGTSIYSANSSFFSFVACSLIYSSIMVFGHIMLMKQKS